MKKIIAITLMTLMLLGIFAGCSEDKTEANTPEESSEVIEPLEETSNNPVSDIPNAKEFPEMSWPTFGAATKIPAPDWSSNGEILVDGETTFWAEVGYTTLDNYNEYIEACKNMGYSLNTYEDPGYTFWGENENGYGVQLTYVPWSKYVGVQVTNNASEWDHWWEN